MNIYNINLIDGINSQASLLQGGDGFVYGVTFGGGQTGYGTVFRLDFTPIIVSASSATVASNAPFSYQIAATNTPTSFGAINLPAGLSMNPSTGLISGSPTAVTAPRGTVM